MRLHNLTVSDLMTTALVTVHERETISVADFNMKLAAIRHLPVVDDKRHLVGILSNRDFLRELGRTGRKEAPVHEVMTKRVVTVRPEQRAHEAAALMLEHRIGALPVIGERGQLVGLLTETDFLRLAHEALGGVRTEDT